MQSELGNAPCPVAGCVYNVHDRCLHALRPNPDSCEYRHSRRQMPTDGLVTFSQQLRDRYFAPTPA